MTEHHVHNAPFSKRTANRIARRRLSRAIITCGLLAAALIVVIFSPQKSGLTQRASVEFTPESGHSSGRAHEDRAGGRGWHGRDLVTPYRRRLELIEPQNSQDGLSF